MKNNRVRELYQQYVGGMEQWQIKLAIARMIQFRVPQVAWQDTMQELAIVIHKFTFDPGKAHAASEETILCRLLDKSGRLRWGVAAAPAVGRPPPSRSGRRAGWVVGTGHNLP